MILENPMSLIANILKCRLHAADQNGCKWRPTIVIFYQLREFDSRAPYYRYTLLNNESKKSKWLVSSAIQELPQLDNLNL